MQRIRSKIDGSQGLLMKLPPASGARVAQRQPMVPLGLLLHLFAVSTSVSDLLAVPLLAAKTDDPASCVSGNWSIENQPPTHCTPYPKGLFQMKLPNAGKGGPTDHLAPDSDAIAANSLLVGAAWVGAVIDCGFL
jgi:hypothetical protein